MLSVIPAQIDDRVLIDFRTSDDAGVYRWEGGPALVQTVDFFTPIVDDPYICGQIAAANALSDVYAMGGRPLTARRDELELTPEVIRSLDRNEVRRGARNRVIARGARDFMYWLQSLQAHRTIDALGRARLWQLCAYSGEEFAPLTPALEAQTRQHFLPEVEALEELLERDLSAWKPAGQAARLAAVSG